jgi:hypothetical protein
VNEQKRRSKTIFIRHPTPSREGISVLVAQLQDDLGNWMVPTITASGPIQQIIESGRFARDVGIALLVASYWYGEWMKDLVMTDE